MKTEFRRVTLTQVFRAFAWKDSWYCGAWFNSNMMNEIKASKLGLECL